MVLAALPEIAKASPEQDHLMESLMSAVTAGCAEAKGRLRAFLEGVR